MRQLYSAIPGVTSPLSIRVSESHGAATATMTFDCESTTLDIGDTVSADLGYVDEHEVVFNGYVKQIERKAPDDIITVTAQDELVKLADYFIVSSTPDTAFKRRNIIMETLISDLIGLIGLSLYEYTPTSFTIGVSTDIEINIISLYDIVKQLSDIITWSIWADHNGRIYFKNRKPFVMKGTSGQPGDVADVAVNVGNPITDLTVLNIAYSVDELDLRNRVVVYGRQGTDAEESSSLSYDPRSDSDEQILPVGFYKTILAALPYIDETSEAQKAAEYNLNLYNRLTDKISMTMTGSPSLHARSVLEISSTFMSLSGDWYIFSLDHNWTKSGFTTTLELRR